MVGAGADVRVTSRGGVDDKKAVEEASCATDVGGGKRGAQAVTPIIIRNLKPELIMFRFMKPSFRSNVDRFYLIIQSFNKITTYFPRCFCFAPMGRLKNKGVYLSPK